MKKSELKLKCVVPSLDAAKELKELLGDDSESETPFLRYNGRNFWTTACSYAFCGWSEPLVSYKQALEMIAQIEPEQKGEWVEFDVDENGDYRPALDEGLYNWQDNYIGSKYIFGGWLWEDSERDECFWRIERIGVNARGRLTTCSADWAKPLQPKKIRFWRVKGGE